VKKFGRHFITVFIILLFLAGILIFSFPYVSNIIHTRTQSRVIESYQDSVNKADENYLDELIEVAREYNKTLRNNPQRFHKTEDELRQYHNMLRIEDEVVEGVIGSLEIEKVGINLPIYRGTDDAILRIGAGHIEGTSLPVGGSGTHTVITGHRGLHTAKLLTDIDHMEVGDLFTLNILNLRLHYITDQIEIVLPDDFSMIAICADNDYATLLTCTPIGVNTHRLLIRGIRIPDSELPGVDFTIEEYQLNIIEYIKLYMLFMSFLLLLILLYILVRKALRRNEQNK